MCDGDVGIHTSCHASLQVKKSGLHDGEASVRFVVVIGHGEATKALQHTRQQLAGIE